MKAVRNFGFYCVFWETVYTRSESERIFKVCPSRHAQNLSWWVGPRQPQKSDRRQVFRIFQYKNLRREGRGGPPLPTHLHREGRGGPPSLLKFSKSEKSENRWTEKISHYRQSVQDSAPRTEFLKMVNGQALKINFLMISEIFLVFIQKVPKHKNACYARFKGFFGPIVAPIVS